MGFFSSSSSPSCCQNVLSAPYINGENIIMNTCDESVVDSAHRFLVALILDVPLKMVKFIVLLVQLPVENTKTQWWMRFAVWPTVN